MRDFSAKLKPIIGNTLGSILGTTVLIICTPFEIIHSNLFPFKDKIPHDYQYDNFLKINNGAKFFCYTSRNKTKSIIRNEILPNLPEDINIIYLEGKYPISNYNETYISRILFALHYKGFPNIIKIHNCRVVDISLKKEFNTLLKDKNNFAFFIKLINNKFKEIDEGI